jgi:lambda family phage minor tail protein L
MFPGGQWFYFQSAQDEAREIVWGGNTYAPIPMEASGFEMNTSGTIPQPNLTISNLFGAANSLLGSFRGLLGAKLVRILTLTRFLDDGSSPDPGAYITRDVFIVAQKTSHNAQQIVFKLAAHIDQEGVQLPRRVILRDFCSHVYRVWQQTGSDPSSGHFDYSKASCPYTGGQYLDEFDRPTNDFNDACSRTLTGCQKRFFTAPLPARFFPGVGRIK